MMTDLSKLSPATLKAINKGLLREIEGVLQKIGIAEAINQGNKPDRQQPILKNIKYLSEKIKRFCEKKKVKSLSKQIQSCFSLGHKV